jgi:Transglycosylase SLT domain
MPRLLAPLAILAALTTGCAPLWSDDPKPPTQAQAPATVSHRVTVPWLPPSVSRFVPLIESASLRHDVDANLIAIVILVESGGDPYAQSPAGAKGLMQIMPATGADIAAQRAILTHNELRLLDPSYSVDIGTWYLARQLGRFWVNNPDHTVDRAAAAYNGGPGRLARNEPWAAETQSYVKWVGGMWRQRYEARSSAFDAWWRAGGDRLVARASSSPMPPLVATGPMLAGP